MNDIYQEWHELRKKNGDFICHLDGEMDKLEKKQVELKRAEQLQHLKDAGAFAMQFVVPPPFNCCQDDRDILKALNKAQADRIKYLEDQIAAYKEQLQVDLAVKKDLDEKLDKATADYRALWVENKDLKSQLAGAKAQCENTVENRRRISELSQTVVNLREAVKCSAKQYAALETKRNNLAKTVSSMDKTIRDLAERNDNLRKRLVDTNESLKRNIQEVSRLQSTVDYLENLKQYQAKEIKRLQDIVNTPNGSCSAYTQQGMQSKIAKQAAEIKRLTEENERLSRNNDELSGRNEAQKANIACAMEMWRKYEKETEVLKKALDLAAKDADANFERGEIKGMEKIWDELKDTYANRTLAENEKIFGYGTVGEIVDNLSPTWFINKAEEYHEQRAKDIQIGDEVEIFDEFCPDDDPHSDIGIVTAVDKDHKCFVIVGPKFEGCFDMTDIDAGNARKTGKHYDSIPIDYFM